MYTVNSEEDRQNESSLHSQGDQEKLQEAEINSIFHPMTIFDRLGYSVYDFMS